jgi:hypothetical protein
MRVPANLLQGPPTMLKRIILMLPAVLTFVSHAPAQEEKAREIKGVIRSLDLRTGAVSLQQLSSEPLAGFNLATKDVPVSDVLGKPAKLSDLKEGLRVAVKVRNEADIVAIRVDGPNVHGIVKRVDVANRIVTFKDFVTDKTVTIPIAAPIIALGEAVTLDACKIGSAIQFVYSLDRKTIVRVHIGKGTQSRDPFMRTTRYYGVLAEVDHAKKQATMFLQSTDAGIVKTYDVAPEAYLRVMFHQKAVGEVPFAQFAKWVKVYFFVDRETGRIVNIDADLPVMIRRKVAKLDAQAITVEDEKKDKLIPLAPDVQVLTPRGEGRLADIAPNRIVSCGLTLDHAQVRVLYLWDQ